MDNRALERFLFESGAPIPPASAGELLSDWEATLHRGGRILLVPGTAPLDGPRRLARVFLAKGRGAASLILTTPAEDAPFARSLDDQLAEFARPGDGILLLTSGLGLNQLSLALEKAEGAGLRAVVMGEVHPKAPLCLASAEVDRDLALLAEVVERLVPVAPPPRYFRHPSAVVDEGASVGDGTRIWHFSHVQPGARIGQGCNLGQNVNVDRDAVIGDHVKVQNNVSIYKGVIVEEDAFLGPSCVFTNVINPRSHVSRRHAFRETRVGRGASVGANATIVCGTTVGAYAFVGAGAVVTRDVPPFALMVGVPARQMGWICQCGEGLPADVAEEGARCDACGSRYRPLTGPGSSRGIERVSAEEFAPPEDDRGEQSSQEEP